MFDKFSRIAKTGWIYATNGVFTLANTDTNTNTEKMGLQAICICVGVCVSVCVRVGQCEHTINVCIKYPVDTHMTIPYCVTIGLLLNFTHNVNGSLLPPATKLGQGYIFTGVCDSVHRGGMCGCRGACVVAGGCMVGGPAWLQGGGMRRARRDTANERALRILLECILVIFFVTFQG